MIGKKTETENAMNEMMAAAGLTGVEQESNHYTTEKQLKKEQPNDEISDYPVSPSTHHQHQPSHDLSEHKLLTFPTQRPNERVVLLLRRHWTVLARDITQLVVSLLLPPIVIVLLIQYTPISLTSGTAPYVILVAGLSLYYLFSFLAYFHDFVDYHLDIWVVTDQRIVSIEQEGLFHRIVSELNIVKVQDVTSEVAGKVQTFLNYGQVHIQTAGEHERFIFEQVPHPSEVAKVILQVHDRTMKIQDLQKIKEQEDYRQQMEEQSVHYGQQPGEAKDGIHYDTLPNMQHNQSGSSQQVSQAPMQVRRAPQAPQPYQAQPTTQPYQPPVAPSYNPPDPNSIPAPSYPATPNNPVQPMIQPSIQPETQPASNPYQAPVASPQPIPRINDPAGPARINSSAQQPPTYNPPSPPNLP